MTVISNIANGFIGLFNAGGEQFMSWVTGIIPLVICLMTAVNALIGFIGVERVEKFCQKITKYTILRYTLLPIMAVIFLTNPAMYTFGRFLKKEHKAAFYDATVSFVISHWIISTCKCRRVIRIHGNCNRYPETGTINWKSCSKIFHRRCDRYFDPWYPMRKNLCSIK